MKKITLSLVVLCFTTTWLEAQSLAVGIKAGVNFSTLKPNENEPDDWGPIAGVHFGLYGHHMFSEQVGLEAGLLFTQAGFYIDGSESFINEQNIRLNYVALPVAMKFKWGYFTLKPGLQFSKLLTAYQIPGNLSVTESFAGSDVSIFAGPGIEFPFGLNFSTTLNIGLKNISNIPPYEFRNLGFMFSVGYTFIRKKS